jgi:hypothetical protein
MKIKYRKDYSTELVCVPVKTFITRKLSVCLYDGGQLEELREELNTTQNALIKLIELLITKDKISCEELCDIVGAYFEPDNTPEFVE